ncbi:hypothetical protein J6TS2_50910 [Heyndrickxia sporothermodurans]|nr:hypothetical protein J6TS2_50910 [Heyndrickxia sporothermodurans]
MNLDQIIEEVNKDIDDSIDNQEITGWINRCVDDLSIHAKYQKSTTIELIPNQKEYDLPHDFIKLVSLVDSVTPLKLIQINDFVSIGYKMWSDKLIIQPTPTNEKVLDLYYKAKLPYLKDSDDEPQIPSQFHDLFILYAVAKARYQDEEESLQLNVWNEYQMRKSDFIKFNNVTQIEPILDMYRLWRRE